MSLFLFLCCFLGGFFVWFLLLLLFRKYMLARRLSAPSMVFISTVPIMQESKLSTHQELVLIARQLFYRRRMVSWVFPVSKWKMAGLCDRTLASLHTHKYLYIRHSLAWRFWITWGERPGTECTQGLSSPSTTFWDFPLSVTPQVLNHTILFGWRSLGSN